MGKKEKKEAIGILAVFLSFLAFVSCMHAHAKKDVLLFVFIESFRHLFTLCQRY